MLINHICGFPFEANCQNSETGIITLANMCGLMLMLSKLIFWPQAMNFIECK